MPVRQSVISSISLAEKKTHAMGCEHAASDNCADQVHCAIFVRTSEFWKDNAVHILPDSIPAMERSESPPARLELLLSTIAYLRRYFTSHLPVFRHAVLCSSFAQVLSLSPLFLFLPFSSLFLWGVRPIADLTHLDDLFPRE